MRSGLSVEYYKGGSLPDLMRLIRSKEQRNATISAIQHNGRLPERRLKTELIGAWPVGLLRNL